MAVKLWASQQDYLGVLMIWWLAFSRLGDLRESDGSHSAFYESLLKITHVHFHHILFVTQNSPYPPERHYKEE